MEYYTRILILSWFRIWEGIQNNQPMSEEEVCQVIMCQYPEEDTVDGAESYSSSAPPLLPEPEQVAAISVE